MVDLFVCDCSRYSLLATNSLPQNGSRAAKTALVDACEERAISLNAH